MSYTALLAVILGVNLASVVICAFIAARAGRDPFSWVLTGALLGPFGLVALLASARRAEPLTGAARRARATTGKRILVPVDGSEASLRAVERAIALLPASGFTTLLTVLPVELADEAQQPTGSRGRTEVEQRVEERFRAARRALTESGVPFDTETLFGSPADEVLRFAAAGDYEMIVIGRRGDGLTKALLGSVSEKVIRNSTCAVTVA